MARTAAQRWHLQRVRRHSTWAFLEAVRVAAMVLSLAQHSVKVSTRKHAGAALPKKHARMQTLPSTVLRPSLAVALQELSRRQTHAALEVISGAFSSYSASQGVQTRCIAAAAATQQASISAPDLPPPSQAPSAQTFGIRSRQLTRSGYREYLVKSEDAPSALAHRVALKVPLGETEGQADDMQPRTVSSPPDEDAETREAFEVLRKLVGCLTKDGRKAPAQAVVREALRIMQVRLKAEGSNEK